MIQTPRMVFRDRYEEMSDDELLLLATKEDSLELDARKELRHVLKSRSLSEEDISEYAKYFATAEFRKIDEPRIATSFNGLGTELYGKRDFAPDSSFITTKFLVVFWIPIWPLCSYRVLQDGNWYLIQSKTSPHRRQVAMIYAFIAGGSLFLTTSATYAGELPTLFVLGLVVAVPFLGRAIARHRSRSKAI